MPCLGLIWSFLCEYYSASQLFLPGTVNSIESVLCNLHKLQSELNDPAEQLLIVLKRVYSFGRLCTFRIHIHTMTQSLESQYWPFLRGGREAEILQLLLPKTVSCFMMARSKFLTIACKCRGETFSLPYSLRV